MSTDLVEVQKPVHPLQALLRMTEMAIEKGMDPGKLYDLVERVQQARAVEEFNAAMCDVQSEAKTVIRDDENKGTHSKYEKLETIQRMLKPIYTAHGFSLSFSTDDSPLEKHVRIVATLRHRGGHVEKHRADIPLDGLGAKGNALAMNAPQATGSTLSYGQRYLTKLIFNVTVADEDNDAQGANEPIAEDQALQMRNLLESSGASIKKFLDVYKIQVAEEETLD